MGKAHYHGGSTTGRYDEDGKVRFDEGPEAPQVKDSIKKRWSETPKFDSEARAAAEKYRKSVSLFLAACATAFREETLSQSTPPPPMELKLEIEAWGGNVAWIDKHDRRRLQFAKFVRGQGWERSKEK